MTSIEAKFAREAKENPTDWVIAPDSRRGRGKFKLVYIGEGKR